MAPPKKLTGELARLFQEAFGAVEKRVVPISEEGAKALQRLSPEQQVAMDELLGQGAKLGEVTGTGAGKGQLLPGQRARPYPLAFDELAGYPHNADLEDLSDDKLIAQFPYNIGEFPQAPLPRSHSWDERPVSFAPNNSSGGFREEDMADSIRQHWTNQGAKEPDWAWDQAEINTREAQLDNARSDAAENAPYHDWPDAWKKWENIPGVLAGAGVGAAALASRPAQAQAQPSSFRELEDQPEGDFSQPSASVPSSFKPLAEPQGLAGDDLELSNGTIDSGLPSSFKPLPELPRATQPQFGDFDPAGDYRTEIPYDIKPSFTLEQQNRQTIEGIQEQHRALVRGAWQGIKSAFAPAQKFKSEHIDPVIKMSQFIMRDLWLGAGEGEPGTANYQGLKSNKGIQEIYSAPGQRLRDANPKLAYLTEKLGSMALGETAFNTENPEAADPRVVGEGGAMDQLKRQYGELGAGFVANMASMSHDIPIYLIPGFGTSPAMQGATGGFMSAMLEPEADLAVATVGGAVVGKGFEKAGQLGSKLVSAVSKSRAKLPVAVVPPGEATALAETVAREMPPQAIADSEVKQAIAVVVDHVEGETKQFALKSTPRGLVAIPLTPRAKISPRIQRVGTQDAIDNAVADPLGEASRALDPSPTFDHGKLIDLQDYSASQPGLLKEGGVVVLDPAEGGAARLLDVRDPELRLQALAGRNLAEVNTPSGKRLAFIRRNPDGTMYAIAPEADDFLPNALEESFVLKPDDVSVAQREDGSLQWDSDTGNVRVLEGQYDKKKLRNILDEHDLLVERAKLEAEGIQAQQEAEAKAAARDIAAGGNGDGSKLPPDPPGEAPPPNPPNPHNVDQREEIALNWWQQTQKIVADRAGKVKRALFSPTVTGPRDVSDQAMAAFSVDAMENLRESTLKALVKSMPELRQMPPAEQRIVTQNINRFVEGHIQLEGDGLQKGLLDLHPQLAKKSAELVGKYREEIALSEKELRELRILQPEQSIRDLLSLPDDAELPAYATRMYWRFLMREPGQWQRVFKQDKEVTNSVVDAILRDVYSEGKYKLENYATRRRLAEEHLDFLLGDPERMAEARGDPLHRFNAPYSSASGSTKQRKELRDWERIALGEVDNGLVRIAESMSRQKQLVAQGRMWKAVAENPELSASGDDMVAKFELGMTKEVPLDPGSYGLMAGRRVTPETWYALREAPLAQKNASNSIHRFVNAMKWGQTVGNPGSWVTNFLANSQGVMLSNLVDPFGSPLAVGHGMLTFANDLKLHSDAPGIRGDISRDRFMRAMELGIVGSDYSTAEFRSAATKWHTILTAEAKLNGGRVNPLTLFADILKRGKNKASDLYGSIDTMWKYSTYVAGLERGGINTTTGEMDKAVAIAFIDTRYRPGMADAAIREQVELEVARRIHYSFPMLDRVGPAVAKVSQHTGIFNPYVKVKTELMRAYAQIPLRMGTEKGMAGNMLKYGLTVAALGGAYKAQRELAGVNQDEVDASFAQAPPAVQRFKPGAMALWDRADNGRLRFTDMTQMFEPLTWLQGDPSAGPMSNASANALMLLFDGGLMENEARSVLAAGGLVPPAYDSPKVPIWKQRGSQMLGDAVMRMAPGAVRNTYNTLNRGPEVKNGLFTPSMLEGLGTPPGKRGPQQAQQSQSTTNINLLLGPNRVFEVGGTQASRGKADAQAALQRKAREIQALERELSNIGPMNEGQSLGILSGPLNKQEAVKRAKEALMQKTREMQLLQQQINSLKD